MKSLKAFLPFLVFALCLGTPAAAQLKDNPSVMAQIRMVLASKGLSEQEVKDRLKTKGIDVDTMSEAEIIKNRPVIEQTVAELEAEKSAGKPENRKETPPGSPK